MNSPTLLCGDCLELMNRIPNGSIDMVLSDLPYGTTRCRWDTPINLQELWKQYRRVVKENGAIVLFSAQPFTTELISSNKAMYRYEWIWRKTQPSGFMNAKKMPLRTHENIEIFYRKPPTYNPQMTHGHQRKTATAYGTRESDGSSCYGREERNYTYDSTDRYPVDVLQYSTGDKAKRLHPTQKPVELATRAILNSSDPGDIILDLFGGSGFTLIGAEMTERQARLVELSPTYCDGIIRRYVSYTGNAGVTCTRDGKEYAYVQLNEENIKANMLDPEETPEAAEDINVPGKE